jgi:KDO2-lipid IV(A) lauroyltransferase
MKKFSQAVVYYISIPFLYLLSILPWSVLFFLSDVFFVFLFYILRYRRKVVQMNLVNSFPEKTREELKKIEFRFYRFFTDTIFEIIKRLTMSPGEKLLHCKIDPQVTSLLKDLQLKGKSIIVVMGHYGNWEYYPSELPFTIGYQSYAIYHPLSNPYFDSLFTRMRTSTSCKMYTMNESVRSMISNRNEKSITLFISDQAPSPQGAYWTEFLTQDTPVFNGSEKVALKLDMAVVYASLQRTKRGYYTYHLTLVSEDASKTQPGEITESHVRMLENDIRNAPEYWLWTHRRWKHKRPSTV